jgi:predicted metalloprotease with PDZ domain
MILLLTVKRLASASRRWQGRSLLALFGNSKQYYALLFLTSYKMMILGIETHSSTSVSSKSNISQVFGKILFVRRLATLSHEHTETFWKARIFQHLTEVLAWQEAILCS